MSLFISLIRLETQ